MPGGGSGFTRPPRSAYAGEPAMFGYQQQPPVDPGQRQPPEQKVDANGVPYYEDSSQVGNPMNPMAQSRIAGYMEQRLAQQRQQALAAFLARREQATGSLPPGTPSYIGGYQPPAQSVNSNVHQSGTFQPGFGGQSGFDVQQPAQELSYTTDGQPGQNFRQGIRGAGSPFGPSANPRAGTAYY